MFYIRFDYNKLVHNYTDLVLTDSQKTGLMKGLKFGIPPKSINEIDIFASFELCFRNFEGLKINEQQYSKERFKNKFAECAYSYARQYKPQVDQNLTTEEWKGLLEIKKNPNIVVLKADKGYCVVLLNKKEYVRNLEKLLSDRNKFKVLTDDPTVKREEKLIRHLLKLKQKKVIDQRSMIKSDHLDRNPLVCTVYQKSTSQTIL